jgi:hypothetical protein
MAANSLSFSGIKCTSGYNSTQYNAYMLLMHVCVQ